MKIESMSDVDKFMNTLDEADRMMVKGMAIDNYKSGNPGRHKEDFRVVYYREAIEVFLTIKRNRELKAAENE